MSTSLVKGYGLSGFVDHKAQIAEVGFFSLENRNREEPGNENDLS